jgi:hypothetical protein
MCNTGISALRVTKEAALRGASRPGEDALHARGAPRPAAGQLPSAADPGQQVAPALAAAVRDLYIAVRALPGSLPAGPGHGVPGAVPGKIRQAAESIGAAWQWLAGERPASAAAAIMPGPDGALREAVHRAVTGWSRPAATAQDRDEVIEGAMGAVHAIAAAAGYLAWGASGLRASRLRNAQVSLEAAAEHLREALACSQAASRARHGQRHAAATGSPRGGGGERVPRPRRATPEQAARRPRQHPGNRDRRQARSRGKRLTYRIRELLAHRAWSRKR